MAAPAPWHSTVDGLLWLHRATSAATLPSQLATRAGLPITIGGLISYREGPVGPYGEIFGAPMMLRGGWLLSHVAFMAVDSSTSIAGGRGNWALPKELAHFDGDPGRPGVVTASGRDWEVRVTATPRPRRLPLAITTRAAQVWADGRVREFSVRIRGRAQLARVDVEHVVASPLADWLADGRHPAVLVAGKHDVSPPVRMRGEGRSASADPAAALAMSDEFESSRWWTAAAVAHRLRLSRSRPQGRRRCPLKPAA